jgi:DNA-binding transcriptional regulator YiaG
MTNIAQILKSEISRVARKEIRHKIEGIKKVSVQQRSAIAALRREVAALQKQLRQARRVNSGSAEEAATKALTSSSGIARRFSPARLAAHRSKLGLSAAAYGRLVGVSGQSIYHWEQGKARPQAAQLEALAAVRNLGRKEIAVRLTQE